jgi:NADP-reducing hydrogenase subunit HndB
MKSLQELQAIRDKMKANISTTRDNSEAKVRVVVGMATCGIAAGARPVLNAFNEEIAKRGIEGVMVGQTGCIGICQYEPVVEIYEGDTKTTYVKMDAEKVARVVSEHVIGKKPVTEFTIGALKDAVAE